MVTTAAITSRASTAPVTMTAELPGCPNDL
jgi:hypothetical protein